MTENQVINYVNKFAHHFDNGIPAHDSNRVHYAVSYKGKLFGSDDTRDLVDMILAWIKYNE